MKSFLSFIQEDGEGDAGPANVVGGGNIAGVGVGAQGEPGVPRAATQKRKKKNKKEQEQDQQTVLIQMMRRNPNL